MSERKAYPTDVSDEEWAFVAPYLTLMTEDAPQREHSLRKVFNGLRYIARGDAMRMVPNHLPPWHTVYQQTERWLKTRVFESHGALFVSVACAPSGPSFRPGSGLLFLKSITPSGHRRATQSGNRETWCSNLIS